jgi:hypothetical protein
LYKEVFTVVDRGDGRRPWWIKIGVAFPNQDGSLNVILEALPVSGKLHVRDPRPRDEGPVGDGRRSLNGGNANASAGANTASRSGGQPPPDDDIPF